MIDGLNLFFRNFAMMNMVNPEGIHIGGLGGFFRSLGAEISQSGILLKFMLYLMDPDQLMLEKIYSLNINQEEIYNVLLIGMLLII
jgi:hypothetical protein